MSGAVRVLMLSWEYPPLVVGGLGRHVEALAGELVRAGHRVQVVTRGKNAEMTDETVDGVNIRRSALDPLAIDFTTESLLAWSQAAEHSLLRAALPLLPHFRPHIVHAHDWLVAQSAVTLAAATRVPVIATIHATEAGRHQGWLPASLNLAIHSVERWLARSADSVITCSSTMRAEAGRLFELDPAAINVVPNGVDAERWQVPASLRRAARARHGPDGPLIAFAGRIVPEKGLHDLIAALPRLRHRHPGLRLAVAGAGAHTTQLQQQARDLRVTRAVDWLGFVPDDEVAAVFAAADVVAVPSTYEPFGIVALEATAARTPLVVAETGGLTDLVTAGIAATSFRPADALGLADAVTRILADPAAARRAAARALRIVGRDYTWSAVAARTVEVYERPAGRGPRAHVARR